MKKGKDKSRDDILTQCECSKRYHSARLRFYENAHRWTLLFIVISSVCAIFISGFSEGGGRIAALSLFSLILGLISLVFDFNGRARQHESLYQRFSSLNGDIEALSNPQQKDLDIWNRKIHDMFAVEPPVYRALNKHCRNEVVQTLYASDTKEYKDHFKPMKWRERKFMNFYHFPMITYDNKNQEA